MAVSGIILAGGRSSRMGRDKTLLVYQNETLIARTVNELRGVADEIIIASNAADKYHLAGVMEVADTVPGMGPLGGMHASLAAARYETAFVVAGDMPFFTAQLAAYLLSRKVNCDAVVPRINGEWEPLCAVYSRTCAAPIEECLRSGVRQVFRFYPEVKVMAVDERELAAAGLPAEMFFNLNAPEDLAALRREEGAGGCGEAGENGTRV